MQQNLLIIISVLLNRWYIDQISYFVAIHATAVWNIFGSKITASVGLAAGKTEIKWTT